MSPGRPLGTIFFLLFLPAAFGCSQGPLSNGSPPALDFDMLFGDNAGGQRPTALDWSPDGSRLAFFFEDGDGKALWIWDAQSASTELLGREEAGGLDKLDAFHWAPDGRSLLIESAGNLLILALDGEEPRALTATEAAEEDPKFSPRGDRIAFVRDNDLWLYDLTSSQETRLTEDGAEGLISNGKTDWVYWEEIWGRKQVGHWWSPDGSRIAYYRFDETAVGEYPLVDYGPTYPTITRQRYPKAGEVNPTVQIGVLDFGSGETRWLISNADDDSYLGRVDWLPDGSALAIQRLDRDQERLELLRCPVGVAIAAAGQTCTTLLTETSETWVNLTEDLRFLADGRFLWTSEASGWNELWLHDASGARLRKLTPEGWTTSGVDGFVPSSETAVWTGYETSGLGASHRTVFAQPLSSEIAVRLSTRETTAAATAAPATGRVAIVESRADSPHSARVVDLAGETLGQLPTRAPTGYDPRKLPRWKFFTIPGPDGIALPAQMLEPAKISGLTKHPVIQYHYGGPASQVVSDSWDARGRGLWHKLMAERGYGVLLVDNAGSNYFGKRGADRLHRRFGEVNLAAQQAAVDYLGTLRWADIERIGLWGWSGGGSNTLYSILNSPGTWRAAVSGAPVTNWRFYDSIWTERYLDHPSDNAEGYRDSSAVTYAAALEDALLIVHGTADDNVHPQNTLVMAAELIAAQRPFDLAIHPGQKHGFKGADTRHFYEQMTRFFDRELQ